jgi:hypothetical protein
MLATIYQAVWFNSSEECGLNFPFCDVLKNIIWYYDYCFKSEYFIYLKKFQTFAKIVFSHMHVSRWMTILGCFICEMFLGHWNYTGGPVARVWTIYFSCHFMIYPRFIMYNGLLDIIFLL